MKPFGASIILGAALALAGCASGISVPADPAVAVRLLDDAVSAANHQAAEPAEPPSAPSEVKLKLTVEESPSEDSPPAEETTPIETASEEPLVEDASQPTTDAQRAADEFSPPAEPDADGVIASDEEPQPEAPSLNPEPAGPGISTSDEPSGVETIVQPLDARDADALVAPPASETASPPEPTYQAETMEQAEEVITPRPAPASPFKEGTDEVGIDRFTRQVTDVPIDIRPTEGDLPEDFAAKRYADEPLIDETWPSDEPADIFCSYTPWTVCYRPLYFEDIPLERYGSNVGCLQTGLSGVKFFGSIAALPYKMTVRPPRSCECSNGFSRCGDCPPPGYGRREFRLDASLVEAAAVAGVVYILP
jgi:hypothetical protein